MLSPNHIYTARICDWCGLLRNGTHSEKKRNNKTKKTSTMNACSNNACAIADSNTGMHF